MPLAPDIVDIDLPASYDHGDPQDCTGLWAGGCGAGGSRIDDGVGIR